MNKKPQNPYFFAGVTAFLVIAAAILVFFAVFHFKGILSFLSTVNRILRPIYYGAVLAFLLLPIHRAILRFLTGLTPDSRLSENSLILRDSLTSCYRLFSAVTFH